MAGSDDPYGGGGSGGISPPTLPGGGYPTYAQTLQAIYAAVTAKGYTFGPGEGQATSGTGTVYKHSLTYEGNLKVLRIYIDLTGLGTSTTDLDVIGVAGGAAHLGRITAAEIGTVEAIRMTCLELPVTGADDIILYSADEGTAVFDDGIAALTADTVLIYPAAAWANGTVKGATAVPAANQYLYLVNGEAGTVGTYTAGKFLIEMYGYAA